MTRERNLRNALTACALIVSLMTTSVVLASAPTVATPQSNPNALNVTGTITSTGLPFTGVLDITRFSKSGNNLIATGTLTSTTAGIVGSQTVSFPVLVNDATCEILNLSLGPLDLNLLGLMVHLDEVNLVITAQQGPGNLLGNLLCAIANLLNDGNPLSDIAGLLNRILRILG